MDSAAAMLREEGPGRLSKFDQFPAPVYAPAFDDDGKVVGAVNLLVPVDGSAHADLVATAAKCRNLAQWVSDSQASETLKHMADECDGHAAVLRLD